MRLKSLLLKNFRCFTDEAIEFDRYTALVGANNAGKSALISALDIFFRSNPKSIPISHDDFFRRDFSKQLEISLTFSNLSKEAIEAFNHYVRSDELTFFIKANFKDGKLSASLHGTRLANPDFAGFFEFTTAGEKRDFYNALTSKFELPKWQNQTQAAEALRSYENSNPHLNTPLTSDDKAFGAEGPVSKLRQFIDFVHIPAVKDAGEEAVEARNTAFTRLIERAVRANLKIDERVEKIRENAQDEIEAIAKDHEKTLSSLEQKIEEEYRKFNASESRLHLGWSPFESKNLEIKLPPVQLEVSDDLIRNSIGKFGHGTQRNYIMALLMVSAAYDFSSQQTLIIACEEPELYQHPPQARILASTLLELASEQTQVIITTHSPHFIAAKTFENIRVVRRSKGQRSKAYHWSIDENCALIAKAKNEDPIAKKAALAALNQFLQPQMNELFFSPAIIFVEGEEDKAIISKYLQLCGMNRDLLLHGAAIVPVSGKGNLINALSIARGFEIPFFVVCDGDMNSSGRNRETSIELNRTILAIIQHEGDGKDGVIEQNLWGSNFCIWKDTIQSQFETNWHEEKAALIRELGWRADSLKKNAVVLEGTMERIYKKDKLPHLEQLCSAILKHFDRSGIAAAA